MERRSFSVSSGPSVASDVAEKGVSSWGDCACLGKSELSLYIGHGAEDLPTLCSFGSGVFIELYVKDSG